MFVQRRRRIGELSCHRGGIIDDEFLERGAADRRAIGIRCHRHRYGQASLARGHRDIPAAQDDRVALAHQVAIARVGVGRGVISAGFCVVHYREGAEIAAVIAFEEHLVVSLRLVDWREDVNIRCIFHHPSRVSRSQRDVRYDRVAAVRGIDLAIDATDELLIRSDIAKRYSSEGRQFRACDRNPGNACVC